MAIKAGKVTLPRKVASVARAQRPTSGTDRGEALRSDKTYSVNYDVASIRNGSPASLIRTLFSTNGLVSTTILSMVQIANSGFNIAAYNSADNSFSREGVNAALYVLSRISTLMDYTKGYSDKNSLEILTEQALLDVALTGGVGCELIVDAARMPDKFVLFPYDTINWEGDGKGGRIPVQKRNKVEPGKDPEIELNYPTVWISESVKQLNKVYNEPVFISALQKLFLYEEFVEDMRRVVRQTGQPRLLLKLNYEQVRASAPPEVQQDPEKLKSYIETFRSEVESEVKNLAPEDALVYYDLVEVDTAETVGEKSDYKDLLDALSGLTASSLKSNPSILGLRIGGSQNVASTESMLFAQVAEVLQSPVEEVFSRALTMAVRLLGVDVYVKFQFMPIDLRPKHELAGHKAIEQANILELLSTGRITDDEAQFMLGLGPLPEGAPELSGTFFYKPDQSAADRQVAESVRDNPNGQGIAPSTPARKGGQDNAPRKT